MSKLIKISIFTAMLTVLLAISAMAASIGGGTVTASSLNFRYEANTSAAIKGTIPGGANVVVGSETDGWYKVVYNGRIGFVSGDYINFSENLEGDLGCGVVNGSDVRMRSAASFDAGTIAYYNAGTKMAVTGVYGPWYQVNYNGTTGYIHSDYFALRNFDDAAATTASTAGQAIVDTAMKYLGVPYVWAGTSPSGFDCSGFVHYVYKENGYSINRTAASIYNNGEYVEKGSLQPGDAICFSSSSNTIGHVGIYIGNNQFIHASSSSGCVVITDLDTDYYVRNYVGARHIV
jgi:uncharacterized protein YgiM (DUF1202 family)